eukprot:gene4981-5469_t
MSDFEKARNAQKAMLAQRRRENYKQFKEKIKKKAKEEEEQEEDEEDDDILDIKPTKPIPTTTVDLKKVISSSLIKNSLLNKSLDDDYDPLADHISKMKPKERQQPSYISIRDTVLFNPRNDLKPFQSPQQQTNYNNNHHNHNNHNGNHHNNYPQKSSSSLSSISHQPSKEVKVIESSSTTSSSSLPAKRKRIIYDSDEEEDNLIDSPQVVKNGTKPTNPTTSTTTAIVLEDTPIKESKSVISKTKQPKKKVKVASESENDDDHDEDDSAEEEEELDTQGILDRANAVLRECKVVSERLQKAIMEWDNEDQQKGERGMARDCINLIQMKSRNSLSSKNPVLSNEDVEKICPLLRLNPYQLVGVNWLKLLHENNVNGVLADDMGLGKTVQTIAFLSWVIKTNRKKVLPHLIVVPASTLNNWKNEIERFNPNLRLFIYHGSQTERAELRYSLRSKIQYEEVDVILCTYTLFERESNKQDRAFFFNQNFDYLVLDEAHCIKNAESSRYSNLNTIQTQHRLLLSGTPVQNNIGELLALLSFLMSTVFRHDKCRLLIQAFGWDQKDNNNTSLSQVKNMLAPFVLRRLKIDVLDQLSTKSTTVHKLSMTKRQQMIYDNIITAFAQQKLKKGNANESIDPINFIDVSQAMTHGVVDISNSNVNQTSKTSMMQTPTKHLGQVPSKSTNTPIDLTFDDDDDESLLNNNKEAIVDIIDKSPDINHAEVIQTLNATEAKHLFTALRKAANHPLLLRIYYQDETILREIAKVSHMFEHFGNQCNFERVLNEIKGFSDFDVHQLCLQYPEYLQKYELCAESLYDSPKMIYLKEELPKLRREGHRILVFSQWTRILDLLEVLLEDIGLSYLRLDGSTPVKVRQELIDKFNQDTSIPVFLLSTKAGGLGINLTAADTVIMHDLDFNPENDKQAEDRCHRIGQTKPVTVFKLVATGSVDEDIYEMGERKSRLSQAVLSGHTLKSSLKKDGQGDDGDIAMISQILSKALTKHIDHSAGRTAGKV